MSASAASHSASIARGVRPAGPAAAPSAPTTAASDRPHARAAAHRGPRRTRRRPARREPQRRRRMEQRGRREAPRRPRPAVRAGTPRPRARRRRTRAAADGSSLRACWCRTSAIACRSVSAARSASDRSSGCDRCCRRPADRAARAGPASPDTEPRNRHGQIARWSAARSRATVSSMNVRRACASMSGASRGNSAGSSWRMTAGP